jgi:hypothetical protein
MIEFIGPGKQLMVQVLTRNQCFEPIMSDAPVRSNVPRTWRQTLRNWPGSASNPYSPVSSIALLLAVGLIVNFAR